MIWNWDSGAALSWESALSLFLWTHNKRMYNESPQYPKLELVAHSISSLEPHTWSIFSRRRVMMYFQSTLDLLVNLVLYCCYGLLRVDKVKRMFSIVLPHFSSDSIFCIQSDVAVVWVTIRNDELTYSLSLVGDSSFLWNMFQSFPTKLQ